MRDEVAGNYLSHTGCVDGPIGPYSSGRLLPHAEISKSRDDRTPASHGRVTSASLRRVLETVRSRQQLSRINRGDRGKLSRELRVDDCGKGRLMEDFIPVHTDEYRLTVLRALAGVDPDARRLIYREVIDHPVRNLEPPAAPKKVTRPDELAKDRRLSPRALDFE